MIRKSITLLAALMIATPVMAASSYYAVVGGSSQSNGLSYNYRAAQKERIKREVRRQHRYEAAQRRRNDTSWLNQREPEHRYGGDLQQQMREDYPY